MGFFDDYEEDERPRRKKRGSDDTRLDWQDLVEELPGEAPEPEEEPLDEEEDEMKELEVDDHGRIRNGGNEIDPDFWNED